MTKTAAILYFKELISHMTAHDAIAYFNTNATDRIMVGNGMLTGLEMYENRGNGRYPNDIVLPVKPKIRFANGEEYEITKEEAIGFINDFLYKYKEFYYKIYSQLNLTRKSVPHIYVWKYLAWALGISFVLLAILILGFGVLICNR